MRKINLEDTFKVARLMKDTNMAKIIKDAFSEGRKKANMIINSMDTYADERENGEDSKNKPDSEKVSSMKRILEDSQEEFGLNVIIDIICTCSDKKTESQIYDLLAGITEKKAEEVKTQPLKETIADIKKICEENDIVNFFKSASRLSEVIKG